jgi:tetratricopeptide (TPR) repeat protein
VRARIITGLYDAVTYRDLVELRDWAQELALDPGLGGHPLEAMALATAAEAAYHRGDHGRADALATSGLDRAADDRGTFHCLVVLSVVALARGDFAAAVAHSLAAVALPSPPREAYGVAALATAYAGDLDAARALNERGLATAASPAMRAWSAYVAAEIENCGGRGDEAERHYRSAIEHASSSGASFLVGVATVGLHSVRARAGRVDDALTGYREVIDYFDRTGNWTHQWTTLRNLADLLRRLGDDEPAAVLDAAADHAPDAPPVRDRPAARAVAVPGRAAVLDLARQAIERNLTAARPT